MEKNSKKTNWDRFISLAALGVAIYGIFRKKTTPKVEIQQFTPDYGFVYIGDMRGIKARDIGAKFKGLNCTATILGIAQTGGLHLQITFDTPKTNPYMVQFQLSGGAKDVFLDADVSHVVRNITPNGFEVVLWEHRGVQQDLTLNYLLFGVPTMDFITD